MKRIIIGTLVGTVIYFVYQSVMWVGGFHQDFNTYTAKQDTILQVLNRTLTADALYMMPMANPANPDYVKEQQKIEKETVGKPWAMVFYHKSMAGMEAGYLILGILYTFLACLLASLVLYFGKFGSFGGRFLVSMAFGLFAISQGVLDDMNWWSFPWKFVKPQVIDLTLGWGICSLWLAWFVRKRLAKKSA